MKHRLMFPMLAVCVLGGGPASPALAQAAGFNLFGEQEEVIPEPPQEPPPLPDAAQAMDNIVTPPPPTQTAPTNTADSYYQRRRQFPPLPPSRLCVAQDLRGMWKLAAVYEDPPGSDTLSFASQPHQYLSFYENTTYGKLSNNVEMPAKMVEEEIRRQDKALKQFLLSENGVLYFYSQGVAVDSQACFIVANQRGPFTVGQMLLMPPKEQAAGRVAKVYSRVREERNKPAHPMRKNPPTRQKPEDYYYQENYYPPEEEEFSNGSPIPTAVVKGVR